MEDAKRDTQVCSSGDWLRNLSLLEVDIGKLKFQATMKNYEVRSFCWRCS